jgi:RNA polymerase sigma-70 factor (ECF subfamily)
MLRDADLADDIVQEVFLAVWVRPRAWQPTGSFRSWILTLVSRRVMDHFRKRQPQVLQEEAFPGETQVQIPVWSESVAAPPQLAMDQETGRLVALAMDHLVVKHRLALLLFYHEGMAVREIAQSMDLSDKAAESLLGRARTALRAQLERLLDREGTDA